MRISTVHSGPGGGYNVGAADTDFADAAENFDGIEIEVEVTEEEGDEEDEEDEDDEDDDEDGEEGAEASGANAPRPIYSMATPRIISRYADQYSNS